MSLFHAGESSPSGLVAMISELGATLVELQVPDAAAAVSTWCSVSIGSSATLEHGHYFGLRRRPGGEPHRGRDASRSTAASTRSRSTTAAIICTAGPAGSRARSGALKLHAVVGRAGAPVALSIGRTARTAIQVRSTPASSTRLTLDGGLRIDFTATADRATIVNLSQHTYWNLAGHDAGSVLDHRLEIAALRYTPGGRRADSDRSASLRSRARRSTSRRERRIGEAELRRQLRARQLSRGRSASRRDPARARRRPHHGSVDHRARRPALHRQQPRRVAGKRGAIYGKHAGLCLETQHFPDSIHHRGRERAGRSIVLRPGETYRHVVVYRFDVA